MTKKNKSDIKSFSIFLADKAKEKPFLYLVAGAFIAVVIFAFVLLLFESNIFKTDVLAINSQQKEAIIRYAYAFLDNEFNKEKTPVLGKSLPALKQYNKLFITIFSNGKACCSQSGSADTAKSGRISKDIAQAVDKCLKESRAKGKGEITKDEVNSVVLVIDILYDEKKVAGKTIEELRKEIEPGINALKLEDGENIAYFKASFPIEKRYSLQSALEKLCRKVNLGKNCYEEPEVSLYKYDSLSFKGNRQAAITDLYRNSALVALSSISQQSILQSIFAGYEWFKNNVNQETKMLNYLYHPERDAYSKGDSHGRRIAAAWAMAELAGFLQKQDLQKTVQETLDYYLSFSKERNGSRYIKINNDSRLVYGAFLILALIEQKEYPNRDKIMKDLAESILQQQRNDGFLNTDFEKEIAENDKGIDYYPGEAMLSLIRLYNETGEEKYKQAVEKAFLYYRSYWRANKNTAFIPWHTQTYKLLFEKTGHRELTDFVFEMNDWLIDNYQKLSSPYLDYAGGFGKNPGNSTASYLEGLADAYYLAKKIGDKEHILKYAEACRYASRFVLQTQFKESDVFYLPNPQRALGGFKQSPVNISLRNDYTQHAVLGLIKVYQGDIFSE